MITSVRPVTDDVDRLAAFYARVTGVDPERPSPLFARFSAPGAAFAIADRATVAVLGGALEPGANRTAVVEFEVSDVDAEFARLDLGAEHVVLPPTTMPWGNRSALVRDPDGTVVNLFSPPV